MDLSIGTVKLSSSCKTQRVSITKGKILQWLQCGSNLSVWIDVFSIFKAGFWTYWGLWRFFFKKPGTFLSKQKSRETTWNDLADVALFLLHFSNQTDQKGWIFLFPVTKIHSYRYIQNLKRGMWGRFTWEVSFLTLISPPSNPYFKLPRRDGGSRCTLAVVLLRCETLGGCACLGLCYATMPGIFQKNIRNQKTTWHAHGVTVWTLIWVYCLFDLILFEHVSGTLVSFYLKAPKISNCFDTAPKHWKNSPT